MQPASTGTCWHDPRHRGLKRWVRDLNTQYRAEPALHELDCRTDGFAWIEAEAPPTACSPSSARARPSIDQALVVCNFSGQVFRNFRVGSSPGRALGGDPQQRRHDLRWQRPGQHGGPGPIADRLEPATPVARPAPASPEHPDLQEGTADEPATAQGAMPRADGVDFRVWAPDKREVDVVIEGHDPGRRVIHLGKQPDGRFPGSCPGLGAGALTAIASTARVPSPIPLRDSSPRASTDHPRSSIPVRLPGPIGAGEGPRGADLVIYELHVGTFSARGDLRRGDPPAAASWPGWA